jgi:hypothetical protein
MHLNFATGLIRGFEGFGSLATSESDFIGLSQPLDRGAEIDEITRAAALPDATRGINAGDNLEGELFCCERAKGEMLHFGEGM